MVHIIKKDGTLEEFNAEKIVAAVNKSAARILYTFTPQETEFICQFATERAASLGKDQIPVQDMHNIVEGALVLRLFLSRTFSFSMTVKISPHNGK